MLGVWAFAISTAGHADVLASESFHYKAPGSLTGNAGGIGLDSQWHDNIDDKYSEEELQSKSLPAVDAIAASGNHVEIPGAAWNNAHYMRLLKPGATIDTHKDGVYYISFLFRLDDLQTNSATFQLEKSDDNANQFLRIVEHFNVSSIGTPAFRIEMGSIHSDSTAAETPLSAQTYFVLAKLVTAASGTGTVQLYVFPSTDSRIDPNNEKATLAAATWTTSLGFTKSDVYDQIVLGRWSSPGAVAWDEIRIATTFADAVTGGQH